MKPHQAAAIPMRRSGKDLEVCLIRKRTSRTWGIPKGTVDPGDTHAATALREAEEEAGLDGRVVGDSLGIYEYEKLGHTLKVMVYVMEVLEQHDVWDEASLRERKWMPFSEAALLLSDHPAYAFLSAARRMFPGHA